MSSGRHVNVHIRSAQAFRSVGLLDEIVTGGKPPVRRAGLPLSGRDHRDIALVSRLR
jgi:hypothetical protein